MDRVIVERAVRALAAVNSTRHPEAKPSVAPAIAPPPVTRPMPPKGERQAACGSPHCAGCYDIEPGVRIHPPKCGEDYRAWLERWQAKGRLQ